MSTWIALSLALGGLGIPLLVFIFMKVRENTSSKKSLYANFEWLCAKFILWVWGIVTLPLNIIKAFFYAHDGEKRFRFSLTRMIFALASVLMLFRLFIGGKSIDVVNVGPEITMSSKKTRSWFSAKKIQSKQVSVHELLLFLIIAGLYYFRRDLNRGDQKGFFERLVVLIGEAYAMKIAGAKSDSNASSVPILPPPEVEKKIEKELSVKPPEAPPEK